MGFRIGVVEKKGIWEGNWGELCRYLDLELEFGIWNLEFGSGLKVSLGWRFCILCFVSFEVWYCIIMAFEMRLYSSLFTW